MSNNYNEADTKFTAIGTTGSGKTCYLLGMYNEMAIGVNGFLITASNHQAGKIENWIDTLSEDHEYPAGTFVPEDYRFSLSYKGKNLESVQWKDYPGGIITNKSAENDMLTELEESIKKSAVLYVFIDGDWLCEEVHEEKIKKVKQKCALKVNSFIQQYANANDETFPPIVFIVTKRDKCAHYFTPGNDDKELEDIIRKSFSSVFTDNSTVYITSVTLGNDIETKNDFSPEDMHIPFFIGLYHDYFDFVMCIKGAVEREVYEIEDNNDFLRKEKKYEESWWIKTKQRKERIADLNSKIISNNKSISEKQSKLEQYKKLLTSIADQLLRDSEHFLCFENNNKVIFNRKDI